MPDDIGDEAKEIIRRLGAIDRSSGLVDHARAENALQRHLAALDLAPMPIRWVVDATCGYEATIGASTVAWDGFYGAVHSAVWENPSHAVRLVAWRAAWDAAESAAYNIARNAAYSAVQDAAKNTVRCLGVIAAYSAVEVAARSVAIENNIAVWMPLLDAAEAGLWLYWILDTEIIAAPRPALSIAEHRLHCETGPAVSWPEGAKFWFWKGTRVSQQTIETPETLTPAQIDEEPNIEGRRIMIERFGTERYIREGNAELIASDPMHGDLYRKRRKRDTDVVMLHVKNNTAEPDGTVREFWIRIHPECCPFRARDKWVGDPQIMTPLNARASTWGLTGDVFQHLAEAS